MKSTSLSLSCSIVVTLAAVCCRFSDAIDWSEYPNGELLKSEVIFSFPRNVVLSQVDGGNVTAKQYRLAARIRSLKLLYALLCYCRYTAASEPLSLTRSTIITPTKDIIDFMNRHQTKVSDLESALNNTILHPRNADAELYQFYPVVLQFEDAVYRLLFEDVKMFNFTMSCTPNMRFFNAKLEAAIKTLSFFDNLADDETSKKYLPLNSNDECKREPVNYFYNKIRGEYANVPPPPPPPPKREENQGNEKEEEEEGEEEVENQILIYFIEQLKL